MKKKQKKSEVNTQLGDNSCKIWQVANSNLSIKYCLVYLGFDELFNNFNGTQMWYTGYGARHLFRARGYLFTEHCFRFANN